MRVSGGEWRGMGGVVGGLINSCRRKGGQGREGTVINW